MRTLLLCLCAIVVCHAASFRGTLRATLPDAVVDGGGPLTVALAATEIDRKTGEVKKRDPAAVAERAASFSLTPYRFNLFTDEVMTVPATSAGGGRWTLNLPADLPADHYLLTAIVADDDGHLHSQAKVMSDGRKYGRFVHRQVIGIRGTAQTFCRVHTERARCVFNTGEVVRLFVSATAAHQATVTLTPRHAGGTSQVLIKASVTPGTTAFDLGTATTDAIAPGDYDLVVTFGGTQTDSYRLRFISPHTTSGGGRWAHTMPFGVGAGFDGSWADPTKLQGHRYKGMIDRVLKRIHHASIWVNFFANSYPILGPRQRLPVDPGLPPAPAQHRPSLTNAFYQALMAEGIALGICSGYGEDYAAEKYMPLPTAIDADMRILARKYLTAGLGAAQFPHFVALYTDYYGHMDYTGGGEISDTERHDLLEAVWQQATTAAGITDAKRPLRFPFDTKKMPKTTADLLKDRNKRKAWSAFLKEKQAAHGNDRKWFDKHYPSEADKLKVWQAAWAAAGVSPAPKPPTYVPVPELDQANTERFGKDAAYAYASHNLRGVERCYDTITTMVETELPAVYTIHNKGAMNHSSVGHAWTGTRTPNIDPAYAFGATALSVSEWNLDSVPKPYFLPTFYVQPQVDAGRPVYQCGLWKQMGMPSRFMRDAVFWAGRGIQTYFDQTGNMTWGHQGADQTTYAANERMASVTEFLTYHSDLIPRLQPVREVGLYIPPVGGPWGTGITRGHFVATLASLMSGYQTHFVSHGQIAEGGLERYPVLYAPSIHGPERFFPFEITGLKQYIAQGGHIIASQAPGYYHPPEAYTPAGIKVEKVPELDGKGQPRRNRDGSPKMKDLWHDSPEQWATVTRDYVWSAFDKGVTAAPINVHDLYTHIDENGKKAKWTGSHWTGHHKWAPYRGGALGQFDILQKAYAAHIEPMVIKDAPEVFVAACTPKDAAAKGLYLFASNWTLPTHPDLFRLRIPQGLFNSGVEPVVTTLKVKADDVAVVYDLIAGESVPFTRAGNRIVFKARLDSVEGRIYACLPKAVAKLDLQVPARAKAGSLVQPVAQLLDQNGTVIPVLGSYRLQVTDARGRSLLDIRRAASLGQSLPAIRIPANAGDAIRVFITDTLSGQQAATAIAVTKPLLSQATPAQAVTVHRGDRIHAFLNKPAIVIHDGGPVSFDKTGTKKAGDDSPHLAVNKAWAAKVASALGLSVQDSRAAIAARLYAHPWSGKMAGARTRGTVPGLRIDQPVVLVGNPDHDRYLDLLERTGVAGRSLGPDNVGNGRAVIAWAPRCFSTDHDTILVAARDEAGLNAAIASLKHLKAGAVADPAYMAREARRRDWLPAEVRLYKDQAGITKAPVQKPLTGNDAQVRHRDGWRKLATTMGTAVFAIDASSGGVAVGTKSWAKPLGLLGTDGTIRGFWGGGTAITPRDVGINAAGTIAAGGFSLLGASNAWRANGSPAWAHRSGVAYKQNNPFSWDSYKDSDRQLGVSPTHDTFIAVTTDALIAYDSTGKERWRIACAQPADRPQGNPHPEIAFSPDGKLVLLAPLVDSGERSATFTITKMRKDDRGRFNKRNTYQEEATVSGRLLLKKLMLVDVATGKPKWSHVTGASLIDPANSLTFWSGGRASAYERDGDRWRKWEATAETAPAELAKVLDSRLVVPFSHLYSTVGPQGTWTLIGTREAKFQLLDDQGKALRAFEPRQLPGALNPGKGIPPSVAVANDPKHLLLYAAESTALFRVKVHIDSEAQRTKARQIQERNQATISRIKGELRNNKNYKQYGKKAYLQAFADEIEVPADLEKLLIGQMGRVPAEARAKRRRDYRWFRPIIERIEQRLFDNAKETLDTAVGLIVDKRIDLPDRIADLAVSADLASIWVSCWDQTIRKVDVASGTTHWETKVIGGCQLDLVTSDGALYAGGSRGDVYRINAKDGTAEWHVNITDATNALE